MSTLLKIVVLAGIVLFFACDECRNLDCVASDMDGNFRIVSDTSGKDLVFGPNKIYNKDSIRFYSINGPDTIVFKPDAVPVVGTPDSALRVFFNPNYPTAYMRLSDGDVDTLVLTTESYDTDCCGRIYNVKNFRFNNSVDIPGQQVVHEIRK